MVSAWITLNTNAQDGFPHRVDRFKGERWEPFGDTRQVFGAPTD